MVSIDRILGHIKSSIKLTLSCNPDHFLLHSIQDHVMQYAKDLGVTNPVDIEYLMSNVLDSLKETPPPQVISIHKPGWVKLSKISDDYDNGLWERYSEYLTQDNKSFNVDSLDIATDKILDYVHDPKQPGSWSRRGMVVGHVQSGKTSNYIGLINKAIAHGYKLVIVLTGMYDDLRIQTQERIDYGVIGKLSASTSEKARGDKVGVGDSDIRTISSIQSLTSIKPSNPKPGGDFNDSSAPNSLMGKNHNITYILAIKKNKSILEAVIRWLTSLCVGEKDMPKLKNFPALIIDDEADSASVNSAKDEEDPKTINRYIRVVMNMLDQVSYVGYTATPYANIFIDNTDNEKFAICRNIKYDISKDLFPEDFIINLSVNEIYFGPQTLFGGGSELKLVKDLDKYDDFYREIFPASINSETQLPCELPDSLLEAILHYFFVSIIREKRDGRKSHNSMLVHVSLRVAWIDMVSHLIEKHIDNLKKQARSRNKELKKRSFKVLDEIKRTSIYTNSCGYKFDLNSIEDFEALWNELVNIIELTSVVAVHGGWNEKALIQQHETVGFEYGELPRYYILVGGNRLSRGITLEGLTTSYFIRVSKMYDSLMQMGRWFGYRGNYLDLCRLYTSSELIRWYEFITLATEELRDEFKKLTYKITPRNYTLKVLKSPDQLKITSLARMRHSKVMQFSFNGKVAATNVFEDDVKLHENNTTILLKNLSKIRVNPTIDKITKPRLFWRNVSCESVLEIIENIEVHPDVADHHYLVQKFILENKDIYKNGYNIILVNSEHSDNERAFRFIDVNIDGQQNPYKIYGNIRMPDKDPKIATTPEYFRINKDGLTDSADKFYDMEVLYGEKGKTFTAQNGQYMRSETNVPLILLYLIDAYSSLSRQIENTKGLKMNYNQLKICKKNVLIPSYYIVFPKIKDGKIRAVDYVVNLIDENNDFQESDD